MARRPFLISLSCMSVLFWPSGSKGKLSRKPDCSSNRHDQSVIGGPDPATLIGKRPRL